MKSLYLLALGCSVAVATATDTLPAGMHRSNAIYSLHEGATAGCTATLEARITDGDNVNAKDEMGNTPLILAVLNGHADAAAILLEAGADPMTPDAAGRKPSELAGTDELRAVCMKGEAARAKELELVAAVADGDVQSVEALLKEHVSPDAFTADNSKNALILAAQNGNTDIVERLLQAYADVDAVSADKLTALHVAAAADKPAVVTMLLAAGAEPMAQAGNGATPLHDAAWNGRLKAVEALIPAYRDCNFCPDGRWLPSPVAMAITHGNAAMVRLFCENGYNPNVTRKRDDEPALITAVKSNRREIAEILIKAGADKTTKDKEGKTAADYAEGDMKNLF